MATIVDVLENSVRMLQRELEAKCCMCEGSGKRMDYQLVEIDCPHCDGSGRRGRGTSFSIVCPLCEGSCKTQKGKEVEVDCDCDGGIVRVGRHAAPVASGALAGCVIEMSKAREAAEFGTLNAILDWAYVYVMEVVAEELKQAKANPQYAERTRAAIQRGIQGFEDEHTDCKLVGGALTQEELDKLLDEGGG